MSVDPIVAKAMSGPIEVTELDEVASGLACSRDQVADDFARTVARRYLTGEISWESGDEAMNALNAAYSRDNRCPSGLAMEVYLAFDEGEYYHSDAQPDGEIRTKSRLAKLADRLGA